MEALKIYRDRTDNDGDNSGVPWRGSRVPWRGLCSLRIYLKMCANQTPVFNVNYWMGQFGLLQAGW